jgi:hypothetical protein
MKKRKESEDGKYYHDSLRPYPTDFRLPCVVNYAKGGTYSVGFPSNDPSYFRDSEGRCGFGLPIETASGSKVSSCVDRGCLKLGRFERIGPPAKTTLWRPRWPLSLQWGSRWLLRQSKMDGVCL